MAGYNFDLYPTNIDKYNDSSKTTQRSTYGSSFMDSSIFSDVDYSSAYDDIIDSFEKSLEENAAAREKEEAEARAAEEAKAKADKEAEDKTTGETTPEEGTPPAGKTDPTGGTTPEEGTTPEDETDPTGETEEIKYTDDELSLIHNTTEDILDATVRVKTGPFSAGTDEDAFIEALGSEEVTPRILQGVQEKLKEQGHDLYELIRGETSGGTEDVLEGYALAKLGGKSKESGTKLESYEKYADMDKNSVEYKNYIRTCVSLFKTAVNGWGTDEKVLCYIMSLPQDMLADVKASYGDGFDDRAKGEVSGKIKENFFQ